MAHFSEMNFLFINSPKTSAQTDPTKSLNNTVGDNKRSIYSPNLRDYSDYDQQHYFVFKGGHMGGNWDNPAEKKTSPIIKTQNLGGTKRTINYGTTDANGIPFERKFGNTGTQAIKNYIKTSVYDNKNKNPYLQIIEDFNGTKSSPSLLIRSSDLAYLRELGVHPINRMVILRRFAEGQMVPEKLDEINAVPISVVVGWLKPDDNFGKYSFNETWTTTQKRLDELFTDMIKENFFKGSNLQSIMPVPGFARGLLFELLRRTGILGDQDSPWSWNNIPIGDPNVLAEGPYRDPSSQNLKSSIQFSFETTYEQKFIGDVDPGAAMIDIIDNLLKMGTSDMKYWLNGQSKIMTAAKDAISSGDSNNLNYWWELISNILKGLGKAITEIITGAYEGIQTAFAQGNIKEYGLEKLKQAAQTILTATIAKYRWELKGSLELMTGGRESSTPWYLTIGNPYQPWFSTNHIIVNTVEIETSNEVGFNDMPMWLKVTINCSQSRNLGANEIIRMFNNSFLREYSVPPELDPLYFNSGDIFTASQNLAGVGATTQDKQLDRNGNPIVSRMSSIGTPQTNTTIPQINQRP